LPPPVATAPFARGAVNAGAILLHLIGVRCQHGDAGFAIDGN